MHSPESLIAQYTAAAKSCDRDALLSLYSPKLRMFDLMLPWEYRGLDDWARQVDHWFTGVGSDPHVEASDVEVRIADRLAVLTMFMRYSHVEDDGQRFSMTNRLTWIVEQNGDGWQIVHEHTSVPLKMEDMSPQFDP